MHEGVCNHGTFSPRPASPQVDGLLGFAANTEDGASVDSGSEVNKDWKTWLRSRIKTRRMGQSSQLAEQAGFNDTALM